MTTTYRRTILATLLVAPLLTMAQSGPYPNKPVKVLVPFNAGAATDIVARAILERMSRQMGQPFIIDNKPGAGGTIASAIVAHAEPDGYTLLVHSNTFTVLPSTYRNLNYDPINGFVGVAALASVPMVFVTGTGKGVKTLKDMVTAGIAKPNSLNCASAGLGGATHLGSERLRTAGGFDCVHIAFKGSGEAMAEVIAGRVDYYMTPIGMAIPFIKDGKLVPLGVSSLTRSPAMPDVPTTAEAGYPNSDYAVWHGMFASAKTPRAILNRLNEEALKAINSPEIKERFNALVLDPMPMNPDQFAAFLKKDFAVNSELVKAAGIKPN